MKKYLLLIALLFGVTLNFAYADDKNLTEEELLRKSQLSEPQPFSKSSFDTSLPSPFAEITQQNTPTIAAASTGYYWVDSDEELDKTMFPNYRPGPRYIDTSFEPQLWRRITPGPRIIPQSYWTSSSNKEGLSFFRNPADGSFDGAFWTAPEDSTDDAIAGPIPLGIKGGFFFNGIRYDSFYVTTNGLIALTNRRYFYDANGNRVIPAGATSCYDPMSMDWFAGGIRGRDTNFVRNWDGSQDSIFAPGTPNTINNKMPVRDGLGNITYDNGLADPTPDNFGYLFSVLGADPTNITGFDRTNKQGGIRKRSPGTAGFNSINPNCKSAYIAPFWGDLCLSQWDADRKVVDDHGRVFYKRTFTGDSLIIGFYNAQIKGTVYYSTYGTTTVNPDKRPGPDYVTGDAQVVLSRIDSSVTIHFVRLSDRLSNSSESTAPNVFLYNTSCGVRGFARHVNYGLGGITNGQPWAGEYEQFTCYYDGYLSNTVGIPRSQVSVKFKQWQNTLRVADIQYRVRSQNPAALDPLAFSDIVSSTAVQDYELLAGHERLGAIQPIALIQNLTNEVQGPDGVNFVKQQLEYQARFRIRNLITDRIIYNRIVPVDQLCLGLENSESQLCNGDPNVKVRLAKKVTKTGSDYSVASADTLVGINFKNFKINGVNVKGIPPYYFSLIHFPPFEPNEFILNHIGRLKSYIIADPRNPRTGESLGDRWPFDDTMSVRLFVMKRFSTEDPDSLFQRFEDDGTQFHVDKETGGLIPSAYKWVCLNAELVSGDAVSYHPLPPRGSFAALNEPTRFVTSPVIKMNRTWGPANNQEPTAAMKDSRGWGGDEIRSFPIDLRGKYNASLSISVQRVEKREDWPRGFGDNSMIGPEPRSIMWDDPFLPWEGGQSAANKPDEMGVQFAKPSDDGIKDITNITAKNWQHHPQKRGSKAAAITNMHAITIFGAGGYLIGYLEENKDSALALPAKPAINSLRPKPLTKIKYDDGFDLEYKKFYIAIPDTFINWQTEGAKNFRFRVKVFAKNDQKNPTLPSIPDDNDDFFVDNVKISFPSEITDIEVASVRIIWPYTMVPASQATTIPVSVKVSNNTSLDAPTFSVKVKIFRTNAKGDYIDYLQQDGKNVPAAIYCRTESVGNLNAGGELEVIMPTWNARKSQTADSAYYRIYGIVVTPGADLEPKNDTTYTDVFLRFGDVFAYDPTATVQNSVANFGLPGGKGLNLFGSNNEGIGPAGQQAPAVINPSSNALAWSPSSDATGVVGGNGSGSIAMKFVLRNTDTLRGFQAYFGQMNMAADQITFRIYEGSDLTPSGNVKLTAITTRGGVGQQVYGRYVTYSLNQPLVLPQGTYWLSISQDGETGLELGASSSRSGLRVMNTHVELNGVYGSAGTALYLNKSFRRVVSGNLINDNYFAYENIATSGGWAQFTPTSGRLAYGHLNHFGLSVTDGYTHTLTRGSWIPMLRPYFGNKSYGENATEFVWCPDDVKDTIVPVELVSFIGKVRNNGVDLFWETASEINNAGFSVERKVYGDENNWENVGFVNGNGNSSVAHNYNFFDSKVAMNQTYQYRLRQVDFDGTQSCNASQIVTVTLERIGDLVLEPNSPNPFTNTTSIKFNLPVAQNVRLDVVDMFGNVVNTIVDSELPATSHAYAFDGTDSKGNLLPAGTYIFRLTAGEEVLSGKMSIVR